MGMVPTDRPFVTLPFLDNELVAVVPAEHPLLEAATPVNPQIFLDEHLLVREAGSGGRLALEQHCQQQRLKMQPSMELGSNDAVKHAVIAGLGVAMLPRLSIQSELKLGQLKLLDVAGFPLRRSFSVVYPQGKHPTPAMQAFLEYMQQNIKQFERMFLQRQ